MRLSHPPLAVASRRVIALYRPVLEPMGLTHPQYLVMLALWQHEPLSVRRLGEEASEEVVLGDVVNWLIERDAEIAALATDPTDRDDG